MKKYISRIIIIVLLGGILVWMIVAKDRKFSEQENRYLSQFPKLTKETVLSGEFMNNFETYLADQFPARDICVRLKTSMLRLSGQRLINDIFVGDDNYLIQKLSDYDKDNLEGTIECVNTFSNNLTDVSVDFMIVPTAESIYEDKLPYTAESSEKELIDDICVQFNDNINCIQVFDAIESEKNIGMYYKTDHHWTTNAAYAAFEEFAKEKELDTENVEYVFYPVTGSFQGTCASGSGIYNTYDTIEICVPENSEGTYVVNYVEEQKKTASLFDSSKLEEKDKYQVFMGGNFSQVDIKTSADSGRNLLVIKDSYANCFIPMLTPYYDRITVIDPRYFAGNIYEVIDDNNINEVLFLYNINSFITDNSLEVVLDNLLKQAE